MARAASNSLQNVEWYLVHEIVNANLRTLSQPPPLGETQYDHYLKAQFGMCSSCLNYTAF